jgi:carbon monoxide dehydrogenase subunit G
MGKDAYMSTVSFQLDFPMSVSAPTVWNALSDWASHGDWIPATRSTITQGDGGLGTEFVAISGFGPLALVDRMRVVQFDAAKLTAEVEKLGPVLGGTAGFAVSATASGCMLEWHEHVRVPLLPRFLSPVAAAVARALFRLSLRRLSAHLR